MTQAGTTSVPRRKPVIPWLAGAIIVASVAIAAPCIRRHSECTSSLGGFCQGAVTACERGWVSADVGYSCTGPIQRNGWCRLLGNCAPYPCIAPPSSIDPIARDCTNELGQCCGCTVQYGSSWETDPFWDYTTCVGCAGGGGGED